MFVDASAWIAVADRSDQKHADGLVELARLENDRRTLLTTNLVVAESHAALSRRIGRAPALRWLANLDSDIVYDSLSEYAEVATLLQRYHDKSLSYCDAFSFIVMDRLDIQTAFTFDDDLRQFGFEVIP